MSPPRNWIAVGNKLFFQMGKGNGSELWVSDGTAAGTKEVIDLAPGAQGQYQKGGLIDKPMVAFNGKVYFQGNTGVGGIELYCSDGTAVGTVKIGTGLYEPQNWIVYNNELFFNATDGSNDGLWKTDGTTPGTVKVAAVSFGSSVIFKNQIYFQNGIDLWKTDGTAPNTVHVMDSANVINGTTSNFLFTQYMKPLSVAPYFEMLYKKTDVTTSSTISYDHGNSASFVVLNDKMYQRGQNYPVAGISGLWVNDGTDAGTSLLFSASLMGLPYEFNGTLFFSNFSSAEGYELWSYVPGTNTGINQLTDEQSISVYPNPANTELQIMNYELQTEQPFMIFDVSGKLIRSEKTFSNRIDVSELTNGFYVLRLTANGKTQQQKFIVQH